VQRGHTTASGTSRGGRGRTILAVLVVATSLIPVAMSVPLRVLLVAPIAMVLMLVGYAYPPAAVYVLLVATPLTAGLSRNGFIPLLRIHEALLILVGAGVCLRAFVQICRGHRLPLRLGPLDAAMLLMAVTSSVLPLLWLTARGLVPTTDDLLYTATMWKFYALFLLVRASIRTERQVRRSLQLSIAAGALVAVVAILQSLGVAGVSQLLALYGGDLGGEVGRGSATLGSSIGVGDVMAYNFGICVALLLRTSRPRRLIVPLAGLFALGALGSGQFSGVIGLVVTTVAIAVLTRRARWLLPTLVPVAAVGALVLRPVIDSRLDSVEAATGLPQSWYIRYVNLDRYVWPELLTGNNWLFGVRPTAYITIDASWGPIIWIESGHTWLLWTGGIPFLLAYLLFMWVAIRYTASIARSRRGPIGVAALGSFASLVVTFVLMSFDPHLTMRGTGDLLFSLLALAAAVPGKAEASDGTQAEGRRSMTYRSGTTR
jgi:hypothetical protein